MAADYSTKKFSKVDQPFSGGQVFINMPSLSEFLAITRLEKYESKLRKLNCIESEDLEQRPNVGMSVIEEHRVKRYLKYYMEKQPSTFTSMPQPISLEEFCFVAQLPKLLKDVKKLNVIEFDDLPYIQYADLAGMLPLKIELNRFRRYLSIVERKPSFLARADEEVNKSHLLLAYATLSIY